MAGAAFFVNATGALLTSLAAGSMGAVHAQRGHEPWQHVRVPGEPEQLQHLRRHTHVYEPLRELLLQVGGMHLSSKRMRLLLDVVMHCVEVCDDPAEGPVDAWNAVRGVTRCLRSVYQRLGVPVKSRGPLHTLPVDEAAASAHIALVRELQHRATDAAQAWELRHSLANEALGVTLDAAVEECAAQQHGTGALHVHLPSLLLGTPHVHERAAVLQRYAPGMLEALQGSDVLVDASGAEEGFDGRAAAGWASGSACGGACSTSVRSSSLASSSSSRSSSFSGASDSASDTSGVTDSSTCGGDDDSDCSTVSGEVDKRRSARRHAKCRGKGVGQGWVQHWIFG